MAAGEEKNTQTPTAISSDVLATSLIPNTSLSSDSGYCVVAASVDINPVGAKSQLYLT